MGSLMFNSLAEWEIGVLLINTGWSDILEVVDFNGTHLGHRGIAITAVAPAIKAGEISLPNEGGVSHSN